MLTCPNCNYSLVLLEHRRKYKCAKCSRLFPRIEIDTQEFQKFNKQERLKDKETKPLKRKKLTDLEKRQHAVESSRRWRERNPDYASIHGKKYYLRNKDRTLNKQREDRNLSGQTINEHAKIRRLNNLDEERQKTRIKFWRNEQKLLAVKMFENNMNRARNPQFHNFLPTISLS